MVYGFKHELTLTRNDDNNAIFKSAAVGGGGNDTVVNGKITLSKISWFMPHVTPADKDKMDLYKIIERKEKLPAGYRMIQCNTAAIPQTTSFSWRLSVKSSPEVPRCIRANQTLKVVIPSNTKNTNHLAFAIISNASMIMYINQK